LRYQGKSLSSFSSFVIIHSMNHTPIFPPGYLNALASDCFGADHGPYNPRTAPAQLVEAGFSLALFGGALAAHILWYGGKALLDRIRNHVSPPEPVGPAAPQASVSLRGIPTREDIKDEWEIDPRTLPARLRIGSRLADLEPTLDSRFVFKKTRNGIRRIVARQPGLKGWMKKNVPTIKYSTAMHYKKLATRLRQLIGLDARIPLEWLLPGNEEDITSLSPSDRQATAAAKTKLSRLLADNPKITQLTRAVESKLGIMRMVTIRRIQLPRPGRGKRRKKQKNANSSLMSRVTRGGFSATADEMRTKAFLEAIRRILGERNPDSETRRLQSDIRDWLNAPLQARLNRRR
jgi:hypothetical protein